MKYYCIAIFSNYEDDFVDIRDYSQFITQSPHLCEPFNRVWYYKIEGKAACVFVLDPFHQYDNATAIKLASHYIRGLEQ